MSHGLAGPIPASLLAHLGQGAQDRNTGELGRILALLAKIPILEGTLLEDITIPGSGTATINHKLGRLPRGWIASRPRDAIATIYESHSDTRVLKIANAITVDVTIDLWVY